MVVRNRIAEMASEVAEWRRDFHAHPELRFEEHRTAARVAELLREFGCDEVIEGFGGTGVVGVIHGSKDSKGRVLGYRADMDALPIIEATGLDHASTNPGKMHACGHDGHTSMLLGAAKYLCETRGFDGKVVLVFQPAEEGGGGARAMLDAGLMERWGVQEIYGMHNWPGMAVGEFGVRSGPLLASADKFEITVRGKGGHGAMPHQAVDTTLVAAQIVVALQSIASRNVHPLRNVVVSVCALHTETETYNVIPDSVHMMGTVRTYDKEVQALVQERIGALAQSTAAAYGAEAELNYLGGPPALINHEAEADLAAQVAQEVAGVVHRDFDPSMGGEDFAEMLEARPGCYLLIGNGDSAALHNPKYEFNDEAIPVGVSWYAEMAEKRMPLG
ncbi:M20 aminoacylase family protein [Alisedimentitalea sp. MJ-SS2]|uniref:M20 aminoacylase family protein n=1 Tax=Aliisedimentitalea sp. MJ-SS2 TaxID=3049795 RepID=UPI0029138CE5|nr:M20 aminoacylase family protein [Alisedimentitalea sp. MJ-SS2]MDU8929005.1 M20 aminoacylase family protein [Alisedimentitalea sp. MJ-SS2]